MRCAPAATRPPWSARAICRISPAFRPFRSVPPARDGDRVLDAEFAEAKKPIAGDGPYDQETPGRWSSGRDFAMRLPFYGFEHVDLCTDHGDQVGGHYYVWLKSQAARMPTRCATQRISCAHDYVCPQAIRTPIPEELYPTSYIADKACEWLDGYAPRAARRSVLSDGVVSRSASSVHAAGPLLVDVSARRHGAAAEFRPRQPAAGAARSPGRWRSARAARLTRPGRRAFAVNEREAREAMALSCGMIAMIDDAIGRVLSALAAIGHGERYRRHLHHRPRRLSRRSPAAAERPGAL